MTNPSVYCPMIHNGLNIDYRATDRTLRFNHCCLSTTPHSTNTNTNIWSSDFFVSLREKNNQGVWDDGCWECKHLEKSGNNSFRLSMIDKFGIKENVSGPRRIDLLFDRSCNLACRICGPNSSTLWQQELKQLNYYDIKYSNDSTANDIIDVLSTLDLSNLEMVQFCGGETLLGNTYWKVAQYIADTVPNVDKQLTIGFQTNGTQPIDSKYYDLIEKFHLVKILVSIDGIKERFNYLRWPGNWNQVSDNILNLKEVLPVNVMFVVQETLCNFNLFYSEEVSNWLKTNFNKNRLGDIINHSKQLAMHDYLGIDVITEEYANAISNRDVFNMLPPNWTENPIKIKKMLEQTAIFDEKRGQNWRDVFPEIAEYYSRYTQ